MRTRITSAVLFTAAVLSLSACGDDDKSEAGASTTSSVAATAASGPPTPAAEATTAAAAGGAGDKKVCEDANKAGEAMKDALVKAVSGGDLAAADAKKMLTDFAAQMTTAVGAETGPAATQAKKLADVAAKTAAATDPFAAMEDPSFEQAGTDLTAACKTAGVKVNF